MRLAGEIVKTAQTTETLQYATFYAKNNLPVFPCWARKKTPIPKNGFYAATTDLEQIGKWFVGTENNVAIATGHGVIVIDLDNDPERGKYGDETWNEWEREHGQAPDTWECLTGGGGRHIYFKCDDDRLSIGTNIAPGVDFRGKGGYVIAPPSVHESGRRYEWEVSHMPTETALAELPEWLHTILLNSSRAAKLQAAPAPTQSGEAEPGAKIPKGARNAELFKLASSLRAKGLSINSMIAAVMEENNARCDPPLSKEEVTAICNSAGRYEKGGASVQIASIETTEQALQDLGVTVRYNMLLKEAEVTGLPNYYSKENAAIVLPPYLLDYMKACGIKGATRQNIEAYLDCIADKNRYNPIKDFLLSGNWDGVDRFPEIYKILGVENERHQTYIKKWFIQCVALGLNGEAGLIGADGALVLQGGQGTGKTSFFRIMAPFDRAFVEGAVIDMRVKDTRISATKGWITELGELDSTLKKEQSSLKAFITLPEDNIRMPYARTETRTPRRTSFCGTVNPSDYLKDETGSRRFWTIPVECIDKKKLFSLPKEWINQVWYQTYHLYLTNPGGYRLTDEEMQNLQEDNREFEQPLPYELELLDILNFSLPPEQWGWWSAAQLAERVGGRADARQVGKAATKILRTLVGKNYKATHWRKYQGGRQHKLPILRSYWGN